MSHPNHAGALRAAQPRLMAWMSHPRILKETLRSGTIAALIMMPFGVLFKSMGLRVGHYGPKLASLLVTDPSPLFLFVQHVVIAWASAWPLLLLLHHKKCRNAPLLTGTVYGVAYYVLINSLALPWLFADPLPWQLGWSTIYPSLLVHMVFGLSIGVTARRVLGTQA